MTKRPYKTFENGFIKADGVKPEFSTSARPRHQVEEPRKRPYKRLAYVNDKLGSDFVTTRCYSPEGVELWNADHGADVLALAVDHLGYVYQTGQSNGYTFGPSLFHDPSTFQYPKISCMDPSGDALWSINGTMDGTFSYGIAVNSHREVYLGTNTFGSPTARIRKYTSSGTLIKTLPWENFLDVFTGTIAFGTVQRIRIDGNDNVYGNVTFNASVDYGYQTVWKWVDDVEEWMFKWIDYRSYSTRGIAVSDEGILACAGAATSLPTGGPNPPRIFTISGEKGNSPTADDNEMLARLVPATTSDFCRTVACSPSGRVIAKRASAIVEIAPGDNFAIPTITTLANVSNLALPSTDLATEALAINETGVYGYSRNRSSGANPSHEVRDPDNEVIFSADHGGDIYDIAVLTDGKVIVAGKRVPLT